jgi:tRNA dimethylallyltransferase
VLDARARRGGDGGLSAKGDAEPGGGEHRQIIGAVADGERLRGREMVAAGEVEQGRALRLAGDDRRGDPPGDPSAGDFEPVRDDMREAELRGDALGEKREAARDERRHRAGAAHRRDERARARREAHPRPGLFQHAFLHAGEQRDARLERAHEIDLAVHRPPRDRRNSGAQPEEIGELVEHLVLDDRRFEIGDEQALAAVRRGLHDEVDRRPADQGARLRFDRRPVLEVEGEVAGLAAAEPIERRGEFGGETARDAGERRPRAFAADQGEDGAHSRPSYARCPASGKRSVARGDDRPPAVVVAGPTASGKSGLALALAEALCGTIVNADSQQIYRDLRILTARPSVEAEARAPHRLYGYLDAAERGSAAGWRELALAATAEATEAGRLPILVGGTGLYLRALMQELAPIPAIPAAIREEAEEIYRRSGGPGLREALAALDRAGAAALEPADKSRLLRAYEVVRATGLPIGEWRRRPSPAAPWRFATILLMPPRGELYAACDARFSAMIARGALEEAEALVARRLDPTLPAMKALGVPQLLRHLQGELSLAEATRLGQQATRNYAKRQVTWFRHQLTADLVLTEQFSERLLHRSRQFINEFLLTRRS